jgi:hypothetical protein
VRDLRAAGRVAAEVIELAATAAGQPIFDGIEHESHGVSHHG